MRPTDGTCDADSARRRHFLVFFLITGPNVGARRHESSSPPPPPSINKFNNRQSTSVQPEHEVAWRVRFRMTRCFSQLLFVVLSFECLLLRKHSRLLFRTPFFASLISCLFTRGQKMTRVFVGEALFLFWGIHEMAPSKLIRGTYYCLFVAS